MNEMWTTLERYQPYADKRGFGPEWRRMCEERTADATEAARSTASAASDAADAALSIKYINRAIKLEETK